MSYVQVLRRGGLWAAGLVIASALLAGCGGASEGTGEKEANEGLPTTVKVVMKDNVFEPAVLTIPAGAEVTIEYENQGIALHNLVVETFSSPLAQAGDKGSMKVKFAKAGEYKFICAFHQPDMTGAITVK